MKIGLFGGAFDPIHNGHVAVALSCLKSGLLDGLWVIPTFESPHKAGQLHASFVHRMAMSKLAFENEPTIEVCNIESSLPTPNYTLNTLQYFQNQFQNYTFFWCLGSDSLIHFKYWYQYKSILENWKLLVATRPDFSINSVEHQILQRCILIDHQPVNNSSSAIRRSIAYGINVDQIPAKAYDYALENHLYGL
jgi:nicotinate-nucleotide adenylyltransferase